MGASRALGLDSQGAWITSAPRTMGTGLQHVIGGSRWEWPLRGLGVAKVGVAKLGVQ